MEAILAGMVEGVIVVDPQGRLQLANDAAQRMLRLDSVAIGRPYVETIRHPAIAELVAAALERPIAGAAAAVAAARSVPHHHCPRGAPPAAMPPTAPSWSCTTSPTCAARIRSAAISSPTSRTSCARR